MLQRLIGSLSPFRLSGGSRSWAAQEVLFSGLLLRNLIQLNYHSGDTWQIIWFLDYGSLV